MVLESKSDATPLMSRYINKMPQKESVVENETDISN